LGWVGWGVECVGWVVCLSGGLGWGGLWGWGGGVGCVWG